MTKAKAVKTKTGIRKVSASHYVMIRCYSGVFFGSLIARRGSEVDLSEARHVYSWDSAGLSRKAMTVDDLADLGPGTGSKISASTTQTLLDVKQIVDCSAAAAAAFKAFQCR